MGSTENGGAPSADAEAEHVLDADGKLVKSVTAASAGEFEDLTATSKQITVGLEIAIPEGTRLYTVYRVIHAALAERGFSLQRTRIREVFDGDSR